MKWATVVTPNGPAAHFRVIYSELVRTSLRDLFAQARQAGNFAEVVTAVRTIHGRLQTQPLVFGEPQATYQHLGLQGRQGAVRPLMVYYAVDEQRRRVYVLVPLLLLPAGGS